MTTFLFLVFLIAYIGLGIPDSLLGAAWPAMYTDLNLPISYASGITVLISAGTILSSFMSGRVIRRLGTAKVTVLSTMLTAAALLGFSCSSNMIWFCLAAFPLGIGAGSVDTALNNYVALHYKASHISFLHCFYGVGVTFSPYLISVVLSNSNQWRTGYRIMFLIQFCIGLLLLAAMPLWKKVNQDSGEKAAAEVLTVKQALKLKKAKASVGILIGSCGIEAVCLNWASTFLVEGKGLTASSAAGITTVYFIGLTLGRFISGMIASKIESGKIIVAGQAVTFLGIGILLLKLPMFAVFIGLFLIGLGNGPLFPNMTHLTPSLFGERVSQSMIGIQMGFSSVSFLCAPLIFGILAQYIGSFLFPYYLMFLFFIMAVSTAALFRGCSEPCT